jgi:hypothetical protein
VAIEREQAKVASLPAVLEVGSMEHILASVGPVID